jgi:hypothetical protein
MSATRRIFLQQFLMSGGLTELLESGGSEPAFFSAALAPYLDKLEMRRGYLVAKGAPTTTSVYDLAAALTPDVTYLSASIGLEPGVSPAPGAAPSSSLG